MFGQKISEKQTRFAETKIFFPKLTFIPCIPLIWLNFFIIINTEYETLIHLVFLYTNVNIYAKYFLVLAENRSDYT